MELNTIIAQLSKGDAYPFPTEAVEVCQTHISVVFLAGEYAYKIKKPVELGFLNYSTIDSRHHFCQEEVRLNRRLAPDIYLGVVPITSSGRGLHIEGSGEAVEWAVKMKRLSDVATLQARLQHDDVPLETVEAIGLRIAEFHAAAEKNERISAYGAIDVVARNALENFEQARSQVGATLSLAVFERLQALVETALGYHRSLIQARAERGMPCNTHGDLRPGHVYLFPERHPPGNLAIVDCIEFSERFRFADPVSDMAFLAMGLAFQGHRDFADAFVNAYFQTSGDHEGRELLPFYMAYRAAVRGKVEGFKTLQDEIPEAERTLARAKSRAYWLFALCEMEEPERRPCLVLVGGLPGSGKSTLARNLASVGNFEVVRSDVVRKELARRTGIEVDSTTSKAYRDSLYRPECIDVTYTECLRRAEELLFEGKRVIVDASFGHEKHRRHFMEAAIHWGVPVVFLVCEAASEVARTRLLNRRNDASDADWSVYLQAAAAWEQPGQRTLGVTHVVSSGDSEGRTLKQAVEILTRLKVFRR